MKRLLFIIIGTTVALTFNSCVGVINTGKKYPITIYGETNEPVYIDGKETTLPANLSYYGRRMGWSKSYPNSLEEKDYKIEISAENYRTNTVKIKKRIRPVIFIDLINPLCLGPFGFWLDFASGSAYYPKKGSYFATMERINRTDREKLEFWYELKMEDKALAHLEQWYAKAQTGEEQYEAGFDIGRSLLDLNYLPETAMLYFQKAYDAAQLPPEDGMEYLTSIGEMLEERGDIEKAIPYFKKAYTVADMSRKQQVLDWLERGESYLKEEKFDNALLFFTEAKNIDANDMLVQQYILSTKNAQLVQRLEKQEQERARQEFEAEQRRLQAQRKQYREELIQALDGLASTVGSIANTTKTKSAIPNSITTTQNNSSGNNALSNTKTNQSSASGNQDYCIKFAQNKNTEQKVYDDYVSALMNMNYGLHPFSKGFSQNDRISRQSKMKQIRQKWESRGCSFHKSQWEDWDGRKK